MIVLCLGGRLNPTTQRFEGIQELKLEAIYLHVFIYTDNRVWEQVGREAPELGAGGNIAGPLQA